MPLIFFASSSGLQFNRSSIVWISLAFNNLILASPSPFISESWNLCNFASLDGWGSVDVSGSKFSVGVSLSGLGFSGLGFISNLL